MIGYRILQKTQLGVGGKQEILSDRNASWAEQPPRGQAAYSKIRAACHNHPVLFFTIYVNLYMRLSIRAPSK